MALSQLPGSGEFVQEREWSCPEHGYPQDHYCDCSACEIEWDCARCSTSEWVDALDDDGKAKMRELSGMEVMFRKYAVEMMTRPILFGSKIEWLEDQFLPRVTS